MFPDHMDRQTVQVWSGPHGIYLQGLTFKLYWFREKKARVRNCNGFILKYSTTEKKAV